MSHRLPRANVWSDASLDEEEEETMKRTRIEVDIDVEADDVMKAALAILRKHDKFDRYIRDVLHFLLCKNNFVDKPLREVWISKGTPFTEEIGLAVLIEQIISRMSLKAVFLSRKIRHAKDACDIMEFVFRRRKAEYEDNLFLLMLELPVIAFELLLYCVIQDMLVLPMKDVVNACTSIYGKMLKGDFEKKRCWLYLNMYAKREYQKYFINIRICYKTLGYPYDVFAIPKPYTDIWKEKVSCITKTFYDYVPLSYFQCVLKEYKEEFGTVDLTPDSNFKTRIIMRKAARRKIYRQERLEAETLGGAGAVGGAKPKAAGGAGIGAVGGAKPKAAGGAGIGALGGAKPKAAGGADIETFGGAKPKSFGEAKPKSFGGAKPKSFAGPHDSGVKSREKRTDRHKRIRSRGGAENHGDTGVGGDEEYGAIGSSGTLGVAEYGAVGDGSSFGDVGAVGEVLGAVGGEELGAVGGVGISYPRHEMVGEVQEKPKQPILRKSRRRSSSRVRWDETTLPHDVPETEKKQKLKPKKKAVAVYIPEEVMSDLEYLRIHDDEKDSDDDRSRVPLRPGDKPKYQSTHVCDCHKKKIVASPVESDGSSAPSPPVAPKPEEESEKPRELVEESAERHGD